MPLNEGPKMRTLINLAGPTTRIIETSIPEPATSQVLIRVVVSGINPKDWKVPERAANYPHNDKTLMGRARNGINQGEDIAGYVEKVGPGVFEFKPGDRVAALHQICTPNGSYAEYAISWDYTTFHLPENVSFEEAATIPLAGFTAAIALYDRLLLPPPWAPAKEPIPLLIYGASTAVGSFAVKLAQRSGIHPVIAIAGNGLHYVETIIDRSKGDTTFDYRAGPEQTIASVNEFLLSGDSRPVKHAIDAAIVEQSAQVLRSVVAPDGLITSLFPNSLDVSPVRSNLTNVSAAHNQDDAGDCRELVLIFARYFSHQLEQGSFSGHPFEVKPGGLHGVEQALKDLKNGMLSAMKYVVRVEEGL